MQRRRKVVSCLSQSMNMLLVVMQCHALQIHLPQHSAKHMLCVLVACSFLAAQLLHPAPTAFSCLCNHTVQ